MSEQRVRHILSLSGGKDSTALAIYLRDRIPELEYVFCDTGKELPETYEYLDRLEAYLGKRIVRLKDGRGFEHHLQMRCGFLPSPRNRWCTEHLKIRPFEQHIEHDFVYNYIGLRADEDREGYISHKPNVKPVYPFKQAGITLSDVHRILESSGLGLPDYYRWRSRSGCYFCFFQQKIEWVGLLENHPDLFEEAKKYEKLSEDVICPFTWTQNESLEELAQPARIAQIKKEHAQRVQRNSRNGLGKNLLEIFGDEMENCGFERACLICDL
jgi:3'-phosphoadenosine 5'-phosphosulfate sulfotransferase (PAPS reductase)/FAD synthetase